MGADLSMSKTAYADVAQLVERQTSNLNVASSNLVVRSKILNKTMPL